MVSLVLHRVRNSKYIVFEFPEDGINREAIMQELAKCQDKNNGWVLVTLQQPKKKRTTGVNSQNHHLNGHIMQICNETGNDYEAVKYCVKMIAVEQLGYPYTLISGHILPKAERDTSTDECTKLIEASHLLAADLGIILREV